MHVLNAQLSETVLAGEIGGPEKLEKAEHALGILAQDLTGCAGSRNLA